MDDVVEGEEKVADETTERAEGTAAGEERVPAASPEALLPVDAESLAEARASILEELRGDDAGRPFLEEDVFSLRASAHPNCPHCRGTGTVDEGRGVMNPACPCIVLSIYGRAAEIRIDKTFGRKEKRMTLASFSTGGLKQNELALEAARNFVANWPLARQEGWIVGFQGPPGSGKTHLTTGIVIELVRRYLVKPAIMNVPRMLYMERERYNQEGHRQSQVQAAIEADICVLDDLGAEYHRTRDDSSVSWVQEILYQILEGRLRDAAPILYTTNFSRAQLEGHFGGGTSGARLWDRIRRAEALPALPLLPVPEVRSQNPRARDLLLGKR
jgi:DNA replication protein DnaC